VQSEHLLETGLMGGPHDWQTKEPFGHSAHWTDNANVLAAAIHAEGPAQSKTHAPINWDVVREIQAAALIPLLQQHRQVRVQRR
jgi:hypothetical protein